MPYNRYPTAYKPENLDSQSMALNNEQRDIVAQPEIDRAVDAARDIMAGDTSEHLDALVHIVDNGMIVKREDFIADDGSVTPKVGLMQVFDEKGRHVGRGVPAVKFDITNSSPDDPEKTITASAWVPLRNPALGNTPVSAFSKTELETLESSIGALKLLKHLGIVPELNANLTAVGLGFDTPYRIPSTQSPGQSPPNATI